MTTAYVTSHASSFGMPVTSSPPTRCDRGAGAAVRHTVGQRSLMAVLAKLDTYRGAARFTTWACKFAIFETSSRLRRHAWRQRKVEIDDTVWDRLPDQAPAALQQLENDQVILALHRAVEDHLTARQRLIFQSVTLDEVPIDVLAERLGASRGAIYKTLHDARAKLRRALTVSGHGERVS